MDKAQVYFTSDISAQGLIKAFEALDVSLPGRVAVKISTGEPGGHNFLQPQLIAPLVQKLNGTIVECNTAYVGRRNTTEAHWGAIKEHGFMDIAPCDIMDEDGDMPLSVDDGKYLTENYVGKHLADYDSILILSHFKGHPMGGFGGALKNMAIGIASAYGKGHIHAGGNWDGTFRSLMRADPDVFIEAMADADKSVMDYMGEENIVYVSVANKLSVDCDCCADPAEPEMGDIGIFASLDPVALDKACVDAVYYSNDPGKAAMIERIESRNGMLIINAAEELGIGTGDYVLVDLD